MIICNSDRCTGCGLCRDICVKGCISMQEDSLGEMHPAIDEKLCINCGLCKKKCPSNNEIEKASSEQKFYAAWRKDFGTIEEYSSGGVATLFAEYIINNGGVFFGAVYDENLNLVYKKITACKDLKKTKGSKYVQIDSRDTFECVKKCLDENKMTLFIGTPCQIAALNAYIGRDDANLITADLVCHGVCPSSYLKKNVEYLIKNNNINEKITDIKFRGAVDYNLRLCSNEKEILTVKPFKDFYIRGFSKGIILRESCYSCKYSNMNRQGDITLGDYLSNRDNMKYPVINDMPKLSLIITNSDKGNRLFEECKKYLNIYEKSGADAIEDMLSLKRPFPKHQYRDEFVERYKKGGFVYAMKLIHFKTLVIALRGKIKRTFKKFI